MKRSLHARLLDRPASQQQQQQQQLLSVPSSANVAKSNVGSKTLKLTKLTKRKFANVDSSSAGGGGFGAPDTDGVGKSSLLPPSADPENALFQGDSVVHVEIADAPPDLSSASPASGARAAAVSYYATADAVVLCLPSSSSTGAGGSSRTTERTSVDEYLRFFHDQKQRITYFIAVMMVGNAQMPDPDVRKEIEELGDMIGCSHGNVFSIYSNAIDGHVHRVLKKICMTLLLVEADAVRSFQAEQQQQPSLKGTAGAVGDASSSGAAPSRDAASARSLFDGAWEEMPVDRQGIPILFVSLCRFLRKFGSLTPGVLLSGSSFDDDLDPTVVLRRQQAAERAACALASGGGLEPHRYYVMLISCCLDDPCVAALLLRRLLETWTAAGRYLIPSHDLQLVPSDQFEPTAGAAAASAASVLTATASATAAFEDSAAGSRSSGGSGSGRRSRSGSGTRNVFDVDTRVSSLRSCFLSNKKLGLLVRTLHFISNNSERNGCSLDVVATIWMPLMVDFTRSAGEGAPGSTVERCRRILLELIAHAPVIFRDLSGSAMGDNNSESASSTASTRQAATSSLCTPGEVATELSLP